MNILEKELMKDEIKSILPYIEGDTPIERFISVIPIVKGLTLFSDEIRLFIALGTLMTYYGYESEIGQKIYNEILSFQKLQEMISKKNNTEIRMEIKKICDNPFGLIPVWIKHYYGVDGNE